MSIEGQLNITLDTDSGRVNQVCIESSRPVYAARMFEGKTVQEIQKTLPLLFSICGTAQACACARAIEQAKGTQAQVSSESLRNSLVRVETLREHLWQILLGWPVFIGGLPEKGGMAKMISLQSEFRQIINKVADPFLNSDGIDYRGSLDLMRSISDDIALVLEQQVFDMPPAEWLKIDSLQALTDWAGSNRNVACRLLNHVQASGWSSAGDAEVMPLADMPEARIHELMQKDEFAARPQWQGQCCETTSYTRTRSPLLTLLHSRYANGLLVRLVARLTEMAQLSMKLLPDPEDVRANSNESDAVSVQNPGIGEVDAARGKLLHRVQLAEDSILSYQIVAPTEWNFHPQGVVVNSLMMLSGSEAEIKQQARLLINAIDPCVTYQLSVN